VRKYSGRGGRKARWRAPVLEDAQTRLSYDGVTPIHLRTLRLDLLGYWAGHHLQVTGADSPLYILHDNQAREGRRQHADGRPG